MRKFKIFGILLIIVAVAVAVFVFLSSCSDTPNNDAMKNKDARTLFISNQTGQIISELHVTTSDGITIENKEINNTSLLLAEDDSYPFEIPKDYSKRSSFTVRLVDRYGAAYKKTIDNVPQKGPTAVQITEDDCYKDGGWLTQIEKALNGD